MHPDTAAEPGPNLGREILYAVSAGLIILASLLVAAACGWATLVAVGQIIDPPPVDPNDFGKQALNATDAILLGLMALSGVIAALIAIRCWMSGQWRILAVPAALVPVLLVLYVLLVFNNWQY